MLNVGGMDFEPALLLTCPKCGTAGSLRSYDDRITCAFCGYVRKAACLPARKKKAPRQRRIPDEQDSLSMLIEELRR